MIGNISKRLRVALILMLSITLIITPAMAGYAAGKLLTDNYTEQTIILKGNAFDRASEMAMSSIESQLAKKVLADKGFSLTDNAPLALYSKSKDITVVLLPFASEDSSQVANAAYIRYGDGAVRVEIAVFDIDQVGKMHIVETHTTTNDGTVILQDGGGYWDCLWRCALTICGPACVACGFAGPAWWKCCVATCGTGVLVCAITCA
jgi:hypothetical protein